MIFTAYIAASILPEWRYLRIETNICNFFVIILLINKYLCNFAEITIKRRVCQEIANRSLQPIILSNRDEL